MATAPTQLDEHLSKAKSRIVKARAAALISLAETQDWARALKLLRRDAPEPASAALRDVDEAMKRLASELAR